MGDSFHSLDLKINPEAAGSITGRKGPKLSPIVSGPMSLSHVLKPIPLLSNCKIRKGYASDVALFLLKVGALETIRRLSKARCPFVWSGLQALQVFCYPPLKWLQRWDPFKSLIKRVQIFSRPLLVLSIATTFSAQLGSDNVVSDDTENSLRSESPAVPESHCELPPVQSTIDVRLNGETQSHQPSKNWLLELYRELEHQGVSLPERMNEDELSRFHSAANGDFSSLLSSVKKAIHWRETYKLLSVEELEMWSNMVFWHGFDVKSRPCLIVRLVACVRLPPSETPRFAQAIVSQVEHGILHLVTAENPEVTVLVDCEGLSLRFPMQLLRSCSAILQDNYPNRLGCLFVIRLPSVVRVIAQTFIQVLKPSTRRKLKIIGGTYRNTLSEYLQPLPSYLGGECTCSRCAKLTNSRTPFPRFNRFTRNRDPSADSESTNDSRSDQIYQTTESGGGYDHVFRSAVLGILIVAVLIALIAGLADPENRRGFYT